MKTYLAIILAMTLCVGTPALIPGLLLYALVPVAVCFWR